VTISSGIAGTCSSTAIQREGAGKALRMPVEAASIHSFDKQGALARERSAGEAIQ
jgi:hypothetical protein